MIERHSAGVVLYRSPALLNLGVPHGFSTRIGGVSSGPFASLNLGNPNGQAVQDARANIARNYDLLFTAAGLEGRTLTHVHQVHGGDCLTADDADNACVRKADALQTDRPDLAVSVRTADCLPILLSNADGTRVAAVHAGWRGVACGIAVSAARQINATVAAVGPHISAEVFEVGLEVAAQFPQFIVRRVGAKAFVDLQAAVVEQLRQAGVVTIDTTDRCTMTHAQEFFSHRREAGLTGRMASVIGVRAS